MLQQLNKHNGMNMKKGSTFFLFAYIVVMIILIIGYALYVYPKNYEILEIDAKNDNYSIVGLAISYLTLVISFCFFVVSIPKKNKWRVFFGIELIMSIILLFLWRGY
jgi:uncharacterized BrkB/YihY/UPF0761 family membrane protein